MRCTILYSTNAVRWNGYGTSKVKRYEKNQNLLSMRRGIVLQFFPNFRNV